MTVKTHYAIYALLGVIILLLLYFVISERSARNTDMQSLQSQLTEATTLSNYEATEMAKNFAFDNCDASPWWIDERRHGSNANRVSIWYVVERNPDYLIVRNDHEISTAYTWEREYKINTKNKQVSRLKAQKTTDSKRMATQAGVIKPRSFYKC